MVAPTPILVDKKTSIPLFGLDFLGILDRGTNVLEVKPITICNLKCEYCFVSAGDYDRNFIAEREYLIEFVKLAIQMKECNDLEIHLAPYGEILLHPEIFEIIRELRAIPQIKTISAQCNGLILTPEKIQQLEKAGLNRLNISLNSMNAEACAEYCGVTHYNLPHLLQMFDEILHSSMELLIAPVWFMGLNDQGILDILQFVKNKESEGYTWPKLRLGIQNYLTYKTGRHIKKVKSHEFTHFYQRLREFEKKYGLKLKFGPRDFDIHKTLSIKPPVQVGETAQVEIISPGRWNDEWIGRIASVDLLQWGVKILSKKPLMIGQKIPVEFIKGNLSGNLLTGFY